MKLSLWNPLRLERNGRKFYDGSYSHRKQSLRVISKLVYKGKELALSVLEICEEYSGHHSMIVS